MVLLYAGFQVADAAACAVPNGPIQQDLARIGVPKELCQVLPAVKAASAAGLVLGVRRRPLGVLTSSLLVVYFLCALGAHARARDAAWRYVAAIAMLGWTVRVRRAFLAE